MGAALCLCPGGKADQELLRMDKPHRLSVGAYRRGVGIGMGNGMGICCTDTLLQTQSGAETREILSDEDLGRPQLQHPPLHRFSLGFHAGNTGMNMNMNMENAEAGDETESDEAEYYHRQLYGMSSSALSRRMNATTAAAFRSKLKEPSMSPASKMRLLGARVARALEGCGAALDPDLEVETEVEVEPVSDGNPAEEDSGTTASRQSKEEADDDDEYFRHVRIIVPPGPCGVVFQPQTTPSQPPTVERFERMYDGRKGVIENCALVQRGSVLCSINDLDVTHIPLPDLLRALTLSSHVEREFVFRK